MAKKKIEVDVSAELEMLKSVVMPRGGVDCAKAEDIVGTILRMVYLRGGSAVLGQVLEIVEEDG